jgi:hypothetical protein
MEIKSSDDDERKKKCHAEKSKRPIERKRLQEQDDQQSLVSALVTFGQRGEACIL